MTVPDRAWFDALYGRLNRYDLIHPDPLEFVYRYEDDRDRELAGLVAACLAYGNVKYIVRSVGRVLDRLGPHPSGRLGQASDKEVAAWCSGFQHRWTTADELGRFLQGIRNLCREAGSLEASFVRHYDATHETILPALCAWVGALRQGEEGVNSLLPDPTRGSACKRYHMYLRWMIRKDEVDPGTWSGLSAAKLIVPLDVHMHRACYRLGLTQRKQASMKSAMDVTAAFRAMIPEDPCRYDFSITRLGIRDDMDADTFFGKTCE